MSREAFEAWLNPGHHAGNVSPWVDPGRYQKETHQLAWLAWKAAQADAYERAAKVAAEHDVAPTDDPLGVQECITDAIRALAKDVSK